MNLEELTDYLRHRVVGLLHVNLVAPGDRLPSIRETSDRLGADHRAVAGAFRRLEEEGLVEVRPASGVYVASLERTRSGVSSATARWVTEVFLSGWKRRLPRSRVGAMMARVGERTVRCACVESSRDHMVALAAELEEDFELEVERVWIGEDGEAGPDVVAAVGRADLVVSLLFHRSAARRLAEETGTPLVVVTVNGELAGEIDRLLDREGATVVVSDPATVARMRRHFSVTEHRDAVHPLLARELDGLDEAEALGRPVLATRAARRDLGAEDFHLLPSPPTLISEESARVLLETIALRALDEPV